MATQLPDVIAMLFADDVHHDGSTGKFSLMGTYSSIAAAVFPWSQPALIVYMAFTGGKGSVPLKMRFVFANEPQEVLFESDTVIHFPDPAAVLERAFVQTNVVFPEPGEYRLQLMSGGQVLRERRLILRRAFSNGQP